MGKFDIKVEKAGAACKVVLAGVIDEDADFAPHALAGCSQVEINLDGIKSINSCGIREWIKWIGTAEAAQVAYHKCPKVIVDQINMVQGFLPPNGKVQSFYVPYFNEDSGTEKSVLFENGTHYADGGVKAAPEVKDDGGQLMEMDVVESKYFKFLKK